MLLYDLFWMFMGFIKHFYITSTHARALQRDNKTTCIWLNIRMDQDPTCPYSLVQHDTL